MTHRTKHLRIFTILGLALLGQYTSFAQPQPIVKKNQIRQKQSAAQATAPVPAKAEVPKALPPKFALKMIEGEKLDQAFAEISLVDLIGAVEKSTSVQKGEFESTSDFNTRRAAALSAKFLDDYGIDDTFAVVRSVVSGGKYPSGLSYTFNADISEVSIYVLPTSSTLNGVGRPHYQNDRQEGHGLDVFRFDTKTVAESTYQASNAYGATITVEKSNMSGIGIAASKVSFLHFKREVAYSNPPSALRFTMDSSKAARELPALKALIVFKLAEPFMYYDFSHKKPSRDSSTDISMRYQFISGNILGIVFYSGITGEILARLPDSFGNSQLFPDGRWWISTTDAKKD